MGAQAFWKESLEKTPWPEVQRWQMARLTAYLPSVRQRSQMYARLFGDLPEDCEFRDPEDLQSLPFTLKEHLREAQSSRSGFAPFGSNQAVPASEIVQAICSSGTTGSPLYYALTARDVDRFADAIAMAWHTAGVRKGDIVAHLVGLPMVAGGLPYADGFRRLGATLCWLGGFPTERILREMRALRISALLSTTSFAMYLAEHWDAAGRETGVESGLTTVLCGGEPGLGEPRIRTAIRQGLGIRRLRETMGLGDVLPCMWAECEAEDGMHFTAQGYVAVELVDPESGQQVAWASGAHGEIVYTAFERDATPIMRYRSRDHVIVTGTSCSCGRTSPRIRCVGRTDDMLIYKGMNVFPSALRDLIINRFANRVEPVIRILKDSKDQVRFDQPIEVEVELRPELSDIDTGALADRIASEVRAQLQIRVNVLVRQPGTIPRSTYKNALVVVRGQ